MHLPPQLVLPREGSRVIMASDGLWDVLSYTKALKMTRSKPTGAAASTLITAVSRDLRTLDDASIVVIDLLPSEATSFPTVALRAGAPGGGAGTGAGSTKKGSSGGSGSGGGGGLFSCFRSEADEPDSRQVPVGGSGHVAFLADVDCLVAYPGLKQLLARSSASTRVQALAMGGGGLGGGGGKVLDYTMHPTVSAGAGGGAFGGGGAGSGNDSNNPSVAAGGGA